MKRKYLKNSIPIILALLLFAGSLFYLNSSKEIKYSPESLPQKNEVFQKEEVIFSKDKIKILLIVLDKKYNVDVKNGFSVLDVMLQAQKESKIDNSFNFKYREYTGLGVFITEINSQIGGRGSYWIYSVNGVEANVGVSNYKIKNGDIISWKYEK